MLLKKGIVRKTFLFSVLLISMVVLISFTVMYFVMPSYYLTRKEKDLQSNLGALTKSLGVAVSEEECVNLISEFSDINNATVLSFGSNDMLLPALSTPFLGMRPDNAVFFSERQITESNGRQVFIIQIQGRDILGTTSQDGLSIQWETDGGRDVITASGMVGSVFVDHVYVSGTLQPISEAKGVILSLLPYVLASAIAVGIVLSGFFARQISKPILQISNAALRMQQMEPGVESGIKTKDELGQLSANLDALYGNLRDNIKNLQNEMDKVNRLERSRTEMMRSASHELKTPISAIGGMIEGMIDNVGVYKDKEKYLLECKGQVDKLSVLVGEILSASRADAAGDELELSEVYADELVRRAIGENAYQIREKNLRLEQELPPAIITTDSNILYLAISNLISNAVHYTPRDGEIHIVIIEENEHRQLSIINQCPPIPAEELPKLFEPFYTRSYSRDKSKSGTGLGLYIVKRSLERLMIPYEAEVTPWGFKICLKLT